MADQTPERERRRQRPRESQLEAALEGIRDMERWRRAGRWLGGVFPGPPDPGWRWGRWVGRLVRVTPA